MKPKIKKKLVMPISNMRCESCVWFSTPHGASNLTCPERTQVTAESQACKDFTAFPFNLTQVREQDTFLIKLRNSLNGKKYVIDPSVLPELSNYYVIGQSFREGGRKLKRVPVCSYGPKEASALVSLFEETQAKRDRALAIKLGMMSILTELKSKEALGRYYIYEHYGEHFRDMKTESIREININTLLEPLAEKVLEVTHILNSANLIYENLKDTYFSLKEISNLACSFLMSTRMEK